MRVEISERKTRKAAIKEMPWASWVAKDAKNWEEIRAAHFPDLIT